MYALPLQTGVPLRVWPEYRVYLEINQRRAQILNQLNIWIRPQSLEMINLGHFPCIDGLAETLELNARDGEATKIRESDSVEGR